MTTSAIRAVLDECDIDNLPLPISIRPGDPVEVQVRGDDFARWLPVLSHATSSVGPTVRTDSGVGVTTLKAVGTVGGHPVLLVAIRHLFAEAAAIAEAKVAAGIALATTDSEYER